MKEREEIKKVWEKQPEKFPFFLQENPDIFPKIDLERKKENETFVQALSERLHKKFQQRPKEEERREQWEQELEQDLWDFLRKEKILFITEWMSEEKLEAFKREARRFVEQVRGFDQTLNKAQIWQALRNYFIYAILVDMQGEEQNAGEPILAYSLLYPYTDNYIDDERVSSREKERYNRMIALKLKGGNVLPQNPLEEKTCCLLDMIGKAYKETKRKKVESILLQLLEAQNCSIRQQKTEITEAEILDISIWKGSSSVLADFLNRKLVGAGRKILFKIWVSASACRRFAGYRRGSEGWKPYADDKGGGAEAFGAAREPPALVRLECDSRI